MAKRLRAAGLHAYAFNGVVYAWGGRSADDVRTASACGIVGVTSAVVETRRVDGNDEHIIITAGVNLAAAAAVLAVDEDRLLTNDLHRAYKRWGIEIAATMLYQCLCEVLGDGVESRHLLIATDTITADGVLKPVNRWGLRRTKASTLQQASFEETVNTIMMACAEDVCKKVQGVTEEIMLGALPRVGSGMATVVEPPNVDICRSSATVKSGTFSAPCVSDTSAAAIP